MLKFDQNAIGYNTDVENITHASSCNFRNNSLATQSNAEYHQQQQISPVLYNIIGNVAVLLPVSFDRKLTELWRLT